MGNFYHSTWVDAIAGGNPFNGLDKVVGDHGCADGRDAQALAQWNGEMLPVDPLNDAVLSDDDWLEPVSYTHLVHLPI